MTDRKPRRVEATVTLRRAASMRLPPVLRRPWLEIDASSEALVEAGFTAGDRVVVVDAAWLEEVEREMRDGKCWERCRCTRCSNVDRLLSRTKEDADG